MAFTSQKLRVEQALALSEPFPVLLRLAKELRDAGMVQSELRAVFEYFLARYSADCDEVRRDALLDTLDFIVGWCPNKALYPLSPPPGD